MSRTRKDKSKKFSAVAAVKSNARDRVGQPKATVAFTPKNVRNPKYPEKWEDILEEDKN